MSRRLLPAASDEERSGAVATICNLLVVAFKHVILYIESISVMNTVMTIFDGLFLRNC